MATANKKLGIRLAFGDQRRRRCEAAVRHQSKKRRLPRVKQRPRPLVRSPGFLLDIFRFAILRHGPARVAPVNAGLMAPPPAPAQPPTTTTSPQSTSLAPGAPSLPARAGSRETRPFRAPPLRGLPDGHRKSLARTSWRARLLIPSCELFENLAVSTNYLDSPPTRRYDTDTRLRLNLNR